MELHITFSFDDDTPVYTGPLDESPSIILELPSIARPGMPPKPYVIEGVGEFITLEDTRGDTQGGLWDAAYYFVLTIYPDLLHAGGELIINLLASWLFYRAMKAKNAPVKRIVVNGTSVEISEKVIAEVLTKVLTQKAEPPKALAPAPTQKKPQPKKKPIAKRKPKRKH